MIIQLQCLIMSVLWNTLTRVKTQQLRYILITISINVTLFIIIMSVMIHTGKANYSSLLFILLMQITAHTVTVHLTTSLISSPYVAVDGTRICIFLAKGVCNYSAQWKCVVFIKPSFLIFTGTVCHIAFSYSFIFATVIFIHI